MPLETRKVLWTVVSIAIVLVVASGIAVVAFLPKDQTAQAPAFIAGSAPPRTTSPAVYMAQNEPAPVPSGTEPAAPVISITTVPYGEKPSPEVLSGTATTTTSAPAAASATPSGTSYTPAPPVPSGATSTKPTSPSTTVKPASKPAVATSAPKTVTVTEYWIQAASFSSRSRAEDFQRDLAARSLASIITMKDVDGVTWYRIRIGPYGTKSEADGWLGKVRALPGCDEAYVSMQSAQR